MNNRILDDDIVTAIGIPTIRVFSSMAASATRSDRDIAVDHILALVYLRPKSMVEKESYGLAAYKVDPLWAIDHSDIFHCYVRALINCQEDRANQGRVRCTIGHS